MKAHRIFESHSTPGQGSQIIFHTWCVDLFNGRRYHISARAGDSQAVSVTPCNGATCTADIDELPEGLIDSALSLIEEKVRYAGA